MNKIRNPTVYSKAGTSQQPVTCHELNLLLCSTCPAGIEYVSQLQRRGRTASGHHSMGAETMAQKVPLAINEAQGYSNSSNY